MLPPVSSLLVIVGATLSVVVLTGCGGTGPSAVPSTTPASSTTTSRARATTTTLAPVTYVIEPGDSLAGIAERFGVSLGDLVAANQIADPNVIAAGQVLVIPPPPPTTSTTELVTTTTLPATTIS